MSIKTIKLLVFVLPVLAGVLLISSCINEPKGYEFVMENPDGLESDTDSINVYVIYGSGDDTASALLYSGKKGDDGFEGPYSGIVEDYNGQDFKLRVTQYNDDQEIIKDVVISYDNNNDNIEEDKKDILRDASKDVETLMSLAILNDSTIEFGTLSKYSYAEGRLGKIEIWNGDISDVSGNDPSATITYKYSEGRKSEVNILTNNGETSDSLFKYDNGKLVKLEVKGSGSDYYFLFTFDNDELVATGRYSDGELNRLVKHAYNSDGQIITDSIFSVENKENTLNGGIDYTYEDGLLKAKVEWDMRDNEKEARESVDYTYNDAGQLIKTEAYAEGGSRLRTIVKDFRLTRLGSPSVVVEIDDEEQELRNYYRYTYDVQKHEMALAKLSASSDLEALLTRMSGWNLYDKELLK